MRTMTRIVGIVVVVGIKVFVGKFAAHHFVDASPIGQAAKVAVVNEKIRLELAREMIVLLGFFFGIIPVDGIKFQATFLAPLHRFVEQFAFAHRPENEFMSVFLQTLER